jgi:hypothetical protein
MDELILEPYAAVLRWHLPAAGDRWEAILAGYLETLAQRCHASGRCVIGHIKALALFPGGGYLRLSVTAPHLPASVEGQVPPGCTQLDLTLNLIVYGLSQTTLEQIALEAAAQAAAQQKGQVSRQ